MTKRRAKSRVRVATLREVKKAAIISAIATFEGNVCLAAKKLDVGKTTLYRKLKEYGLIPKRYHVKKRRRRAQELSGT